jgi:hypothetical protein
MANRMALRVGLVVALVVLLAGGAWAAFVESPDSEESHRVRATSGHDEDSGALSREARAAASADDGTCEPTPDGYGGYSYYGYYGGYGYDDTCTEEPDTSGGPGQGQGNGGYGNGYGGGGGDGNGNGGGYGGGGNGGYGGGYGR